MPTGSKGNRPYNVTISTAPLTIDPAELRPGRWGPARPSSPAVITSDGGLGFPLPTGLSL